MRNKAINRKGQGGEEYVSLSNLLYDSERQELYVGDSSSGKIVVYDLDGNFKRSFKQAGGTYYEWMGNFNRDYLICNGTPQADPGDNGYEEGVLNGGFMLVSKEDGRIQKIEIPYEEYISPSMILDTPEGKRYAGIINETQIPYLGNWILVEISSDTIYTYTPNYVKKPFIIRTPTAKAMSPEVYLYPGVITDRYYFLQTVEKEYNVKKRTGFSTRELLYDKEEKAIYELEDDLDKWEGQTWVSWYLESEKNDPGINDPEIKGLFDLSISIQHEGEQEKHPLLSLCRNYINNG